MYYVYDLETYPNIFLFTGKFAGTPEYQMFEISPRVHQRDHLLQWLSYLQNCGAEMVGFNNLGFDYPIIHELLNTPHTFDAMHAHLLGSKIVKSQNYGFTTLWKNDRLLPQIDLSKINHFDNKNKRTSLKSLQFAMRSESVEDLPFELRNLSFEEMDILRQYNLHDVTETERFLFKCMTQVNMRKELLDSGALHGDVMNYSDVKIGTEYLINAIGRNKCFTNKKPNQTPRHCVEFKDIILPKIQFRTEHFNAVKEWFEQQKIYPQSEDPRPHFEANLAGLTFHFGVGGVHASVESRVFRADEDYKILDVDVSGMYPAVALANGFAPEHLGEDFKKAYKRLSIERAQYKKGTAMNFTLKAANNGAFGNGNNEFSPLYDPKFPFSITVNGQLQLLQLAEYFSLIPKLQLIQANTDGITALVHRSTLHVFDIWKSAWEQETGLKLEQVEYKSMHIRDVNNYIAVDTKGTIKRKGAYWYPITDEDYWGGSGSNWHKDYSGIAIIKGVEQVMLNGANPDDIVRVMSDKFDFMLREKSTGTNKIFIGKKQMPKTVRYYISTKGEPMSKHMDAKGEIGGYKKKNGVSDEEFARITAMIPPGAHDERIHTKNKSRYEDRTQDIHKGYLVKQCNHVKDFDWSDVDFKYYADEIRKLVIS
ncbi:MAG: hypothetical protein ACRCV5_10855 [Afipia sp.]